MPGFSGLGSIPTDQLVRYSSTITIEELTDSESGQASPRKLTLRGPSMPFQGAEWGGKNQLTTTFYPGNTVGTQQNLGPQEMPSAWTGEWNRTMLGKSPVLYTDETGSEIAVINPWSLWDIFEDLFRKGAALRVTWSTHGVESVGDQNPSLKVINWDVVRDGRCAEYKFTPDRHVDIKWSMQFQWYGRGGEQNRTASAKDDNDLAAAANGLENSMAYTRSLAEWQSSSAVVRLSSTHLTLGQLESLADAPNKILTAYTRKMQATVNDLKRVGDIVKKFRSMPFQLANTVTDFARNSTAIANQFVDAMGRTPPELLTNKRKVSDLMRAYVFFAKQTEQAAINARRGREVEDRTRRYIVATPGTAATTVREGASMRAGSIIATYITKTGDTPQSVSKRFYSGSIDGALGILQANRLPWHTPAFDPGKILVIPSLAGAQRT